jgi:lambda family phage portal protein
MSEQQMTRAQADQAWAQVTRPSASANGEIEIGGGAPYEAGKRTGPWFNAWHSWLRSADLDWLPYRDQATARARDQIRNDPIAATAVTRKKNTAVGRGWLLSSRPMAKALNITPEQAQALGEQIELEWKQYAYGHDFSMDAKRKLDFGGLGRLIVSHICNDGESPSVIEWAEDENTRYKTRLNIIDPDRLSNPWNRINDQIFRGGIEHSWSGVPIRYWFREQHPNDFFAVNSYVWTGIERFTPWGRPQVLHAFEPDRDGQSRGVSRFVSALKSFRALSKFTDATLQNATINALLVGFVQSSAGPEAVSENFSLDDMIKFDGSREGFYDKHPVEMAGGARMPVLPFGDEIKLATATRDIAPFEPFFRAIVRPIAARLGVTYEELTGDLSQVNYSSLRAGWLMALRDTDVLMSMIEAQVIRPFFVAWLEEAFSRGYLKVPAGAPDFMDAPDAYAAARWIGPGQGHLDMVKEILGNAAAEEAQFKTLEDIAAEEGKDWRDNLTQLAREAKFKASLGLATTDASVAQAIEDTKNPARQAPDPSNDQGQPAPGAPAKAPNATSRRSRGFLGRLSALVSGSAHDRELDDRRAA